MAKITLINPNLVQVPAVAPVALDILNTALKKYGHKVELLDLTPVADNYSEIIKNYFTNNSPDFVGITFRNAWDMVFPSLGAVLDDGSFILSHVKVTNEILKYISRDKIIAGGVGFSSIPQYFLDETGLRYGVVGAGDKVLNKIIQSLHSGKIPHNLPGFIESGKVFVRSSKEITIDEVIDRTNFIDNKWYYKMGGLAGLRTSNGCKLACAYCMEPTVKGGYFLRKPQQVIAELDQLVEQEIMNIHIIDSEANIPFAHSKSIKKAIIKRGYPKELNLWEYAQIKPFDEEYAKLASKAGVKGILFSPDHINPILLNEFNKNWYQKKDIIETTNLCKNYGIKVMHEVLFGMPSETKDTIKETIDFFKELDPYLTGITLGIGITPHSPMSKSNLIQKIINSNKEEWKEQGLYCNGIPFMTPTYYVSPNLIIPEIYNFISGYVGDDIFRFMVPTQNSIDKTDNQLINSTRVKELQNQNIRGAYWAFYREQINNISNSVIIGD